MFFFSSCDDFIWFRFWVLRIDSPQSVIWFYLRIGIQRVFSLILSTGWKSLLYEKISSGTTCLISPIPSPNKVSKVLPTSLKVRSLIESMLFSSVSKIGNACVRATINGNKNKKIFLANILTTQCSNFKWPKMNP